MIPREIIREIVERLDIVEVVSPYVALKQAGRSFKGLCPFHQEKTPSFNVSQQRQIFHCFGCHAGGDALAFLMKIENISFIEALRRLADMAGVALPEDTGFSAAAGQSMSTGITDTAERATLFFQQCLASSGEAQKYLVDRGLTPSTVKEFRLGYSPADRYRLMNRVKEHQILEKLGLATFQNGKYVPRMLDRIIFPIPDNRGRIVAFGGRTIGNGQPKYINSPEHNLFKKGEIFYSLSNSRTAIIQAREVVIVEGYLDYLLLVQAGIRECLATLGTAMTDYHVKKLRPLVNRVIMVFDPDEAGLKAADRAGRLCDEAGIDTRVLTLPTGVDPADYVLKYGAGAFREVCGQSQRLFDFLVSRILANYSGDPHGKVRAANQAADFLNQISEPILRAEYRRYISESIGVTEEELERRCSKTHKKPFGSHAFNAPAQGESDNAIVIEEPDGAEKVILGLMMKSPAWFERIREEVQEHDLAHLWVRNIFKRAMRLSAGSLRDLMDISSNEKVSGIISRLAIEDSLKDEDIAEQAYADALKRLLSNRRKRILSALRRAESRGDLNRVRELQISLSELKKGC